MGFLSEKPVYLLKLIFVHLCNVLALPHPNFAQVNNNQR